MRLNRSKFVFISIMILFQVTTSVNCFADTIEVGGILTEDTVWDAGQYVLSSNLLVSEGVTLTIMSGCNIDLSNYFLKIEGNLIANGTAENNIYFIAQKIDDAQVKRIWLTEKSIDKNNIINHCVFYGIRPLYVGYHSKAFITNCIFDSKIERTGLFGGMGPIIDNGFVYFKNNTVKGYYVGFQILGQDGYGVINDAYSIIDNNIVMDNDIGLYIAKMANVTVINNYIINNTGITGIEFYDGGNHKVYNNTIYNNRPYGVRINSSWNTTLYYNDIYNNGEYAVYLDNVEYDEVLVNNWWGTNDTNEIASLIYDYSDSFEGGKVIFEPFLLEPIRLDNPSAYNVLIETDVQTEQDSDSDSPDEVNSSDEESTDSSQTEEPVEPESSEPNESTNDLSEEAEETNNINQGIPGFPIYSIIIAMAIYYIITPKTIKSLQ